MKQLLTLTIVLILTTACDINESMRAKSKDQASADVRALAAKNGCMGCHAVDNTVMGPAWRLVANRYKDLPGAKNLLVDSVLHGSSGKWTELTGGRIMPPQSSASQEEIEKIVDYILNLSAPPQS
jgi:cytochrome c551/c552